MEKNKTEQYTFGPEEKEILNSMSSFEGSLESGDNEKNRQIRYYNNFTFNGKSVEGLKNIFIVIEKDEKGKTIGYDLYTPDMKKILSTDSDGKITESIEDLAKTFGKIDVLELIKENEVEIINEKGKKESRLKGISEIADPEEMEKTLKKDDKNKQRDKNEDVEEQNEKKDDETNQVEKDLEEQGQDLRISKYRKINDSHVAERMPDVFDNGAENGIAYSNKLHRFVMISKVDGQYQINENVEPAKMTWKTIISIGEDGKKIEKKVPNSLMKTNREDKEIAVTIGQYGEVDIETVDVMPCQERVTRSVKMQGEGEKGQERKDVADEFREEGEAILSHEIAHKKEMLEKEYGVTETSIEELKELDIEACMEKEARKASCTTEEFKKHVKEADGKTLEKKIENAHNEIEQEYIDGLMGPKRPR